MAKIEIYTTPFCGFCSRAKSLLRQKGADFTEIDVSGGNARQKMIARAGGAYTVPQIFINGQHIGGCSELIALDRNRRLDPLLDAH